MKLDTKLAQRAMLTTFLAAAAALAGCASTPIPADKYAGAKSSIKTSEELGGDADPQAALHLKLAREQLAQAKECMKKGDNDAARMTLERAEADGEASFNIARAHKAKIEAQKTIENIQQQMQAMQGNGTSMTTTTTTQIGSGQ